MSEKPFKVKQHAGVRIMETCARCRKSITPPSRFGSLTSYLFAETRCKCAKAEPLPVPLAMAARVVTESDSTTDNPGSPAALEIPSGKPDLGERYEVLEFIGQGGMGAVWKVRDNQSATVLAVKVLRSELASDKAAVKRFEQEASAASRLTQDNLVAVYGSGLTGDNAPYLIMDYLEGENLASILRREEMIPPARAIAIALQICEALMHAHAKGVVHRDLKPSNIILTRAADGGEIVKLVDFGIAKVMPSVNEQTNNLTNTGDMFGSPLYMSPEHCRGDNIDGRSDIYSFGLVLYELISGQPAFDADNQIKIILKQLGEAAPPIKQAGLPSGLNDIIQRCLDKNPAARYQNVEELKADLTMVTEGKIPSSKTLLVNRRLAAAAIDGALMTVIAMSLMAVYVVGSECIYGRSIDLVNNSYIPNLTGLPMCVFPYMVIDCICLWGSAFMALSLVTLCLSPQFHRVMEASKHFSPNSFQMLQYTWMWTNILNTLFFFLLFFLGNWLYHAISESSRQQGTLGMRLCKIKVVDKSGGPISFWQASVRHFTKFILPFHAMLLMAMYMFYGIPKVRAFFSTGYGTKLRAVLLHDWLSGCRVRKR